MNTVIVKMARIKKALMGNDHLITANTKVEKVKYGNKNAQWTIAPEHINSNSTILSFGIGTDISWDLTLIDKFNVTIHAFDPTPTSKKWLSQQDLPQNFVHHDYGISDKDGKLILNSPKNKNHTSFNLFEKNKGDEQIEVDVKCLETICDELKLNSIDILKIDVEGSEYKIIDALVSSNIEVKQFLVEFHHRFFEDGVNKTKSAVKNLKEKGYKIFSVSPNGEEFSFIKI